MLIVLDLVERGQRVECAAGRVELSVLDPHEAQHRRPEWVVGLFGLQVEVQLLGFQDPPLHPADQGDLAAVHPDAVGVAQAHCHG